MNAWLESQKVRVLIPLVWVCVFAAASFGELIAMMAGLGGDHFAWRVVFFGTSLMTLAFVTGIKGRRR
jgi:hypothetical protein